MTEKVHSNLFVKWLTLFDADEHITTIDKSPACKHKILRVRTILVDVYPDRLEFGYFQRGKSVWRIYTGRYDLVQEEPNKYNAENWQDEQAINAVGSVPT